MTPMTEYLTLEDLLALIGDLGVGPVRDLGLLESAAHRPTTALWGRDVYATIEKKAAALLDSLVRDRPLADGNKRLGWLAALVLLDINGRRIEVPDDEAHELVTAVAQERTTLAEVTRALTRWRGRPPARRDRVERNGGVGRPRVGATPLPEGVLDDGGVFMPTPGSR